jgi:hypothetical protein
VFDIQGHIFSQEAIVARQARLAAYVASIDNFDLDVVKRTAPSPASIAPQSQFVDRWSKRIRGVFTSDASHATAASEHQKQ